jgi:hypothetical protein
LRFGASVVVVGVWCSEGGCFRRRGAVGGGVEGRLGGRGISEVRLSRKSYCFCVEMICLLHQH